MSITKLQDLAASLKNVPHIEVGVFASKSARSDGSLTNADLAMYHEYGSPAHGLPSRSMLKTPIFDHRQSIMDVARGKAEEIITKHGANKLWRLIGIEGEKIVAGAFKTGGYGKWAPLKYKTLLSKLKGSLKARKNKLARIYAGQIGMGILIRTGELRRSFSSRVRMAYR